MESGVLHLSFDSPAIQTSLDGLDETRLDQVDFGVIGFDRQMVVRRYNAYESRAAGLQPERVLGHALFTQVAPCMNNFLVAQRFEDTLANHESLDETIPYVLTLRMRPVKVQLRLIAAADTAMQYVLVNRF